MNKRLKILISCYACSPYRGSEPGMGWNFVKGLSEFHEVHVITEKEKWEKDITHYFTENEKNNNLNFYFIQKKRNRLLRKIWPPSYYWYYKKWQKNAYHMAQELHKKEHFELIHQLNMVGYREPGFLWKIPLPFVWGPIGGTQNIPWHLLTSLNIYGKLFYGSRNIINSFQKKFLRRPRLALKKHNCALITATPDVQKDALTLWKKRSFLISEIGSNDEFTTNINSRKNDDPLRIIWSGQHTPGKALNILLHSLSLLNKSIKWELLILGIGKETKRWKLLAKQLNISTFCKWHGWLTKEEAINTMQKGHLLCITSLKDLTSTVTLEAISLGLPVICLDHCGFAHVINKNCGIKIPLGNLKTIYKDFGNAITLLYNNENLRQQLSKGAYNRAKDFTWEHKIEKINNIYSNLVE